MIQRIFIVLLLTSCVDPVNFAPGQEESPSLIISGFITNADEPYTVVLTRSASFTSVLQEGGENKPEGDAIVKIVDQNGAELRLLQTKPNSGIYTTTDTGWKGKVGNEYHISIKTRNGEEYASKPEVLNASPIIDSVYYNYEVHQKLNQFHEIFETEGLQFYTNLHFENQNSFYMYNWEGTYIMETQKVPTPICYVKQNGDLIFNILSSSDFNKNKVTAHSLNFDKLDIEYNIKFSYNLKQYAIGPNSYAFFNAIKDQLNSTGSVFDPTPAKISGNVYNVNNPKEVVLGFFGAFGVSSKRIFISKTDLPTTFNAVVLDICFPQPPVIAVPEYCNDCIFFKGSSRGKPEFWE